MLRVRMFRDHRQLFSGTAAQVVLPSSEGEVAVLEFHAPMLCALAEGEVQIDEQRVAVRRGIARVGSNQVTIIARG